MDPTRAALPSGGGFLGKVSGALNVTRWTGTGINNVGTRSVEKVNNSLSGKGTFGKVMRFTLAFGLIAATASVIGNYLERRSLKNQRQEVEKKTLAAQNIEKAAKLHEFADYVEQYGLPDEMRRTDNVARYAPEGQKAFTDMAIKTQGSHSLN